MWLRSDCRCRAADLISATSSGMSLACGSSSPRRTNSVRRCSHSSQCRPCLDPRPMLPSFSKNKSALCKMRLWFLPVFPGSHRFRGGLCCCWHPGLPHPRTSPRGWCFARLPRQRCPLPHPGGCAVSTRRWPKRFLYSAATRACAVFTQACHLQERGGCWLDRLAPIAALCAAMGWIITYVSSACNTNVSLFLLGVFIGVKKPPRWAVGGGGGCSGDGL